MLHFYFCANKQKLLPLALPYSSYYFFSIALKYTLQIRLPVRRFLNLVHSFSSSMCRNSFRKSRSSVLSLLLKCSNTPLRIIFAKNYFNLNFHILFLVSICLLLLNLLEYQLLQDSCTQYLLRNIVRDRFLFQAITQLIASSQYL